MTRLLKDTMYGLRVLLVILAACWVNVALLLIFGYTSSDVPQLAPGITACCFLLFAGIGIELGWFQWVGSKRTRLVKLGIFLCMNPIGLMVALIVQAATSATRITTNASTCIWSRMRT